MKRQFTHSLCMVLLVALCVPAQQPAQPSMSSNPQGQQQEAPPSKQDETDVVRITTNLVQVDAVVTDKSGKPVTDLKPQEIQILEDNRPQKITHFSYIVSTSNNNRTSKPASSSQQTSAIIPTVNLRPEDVRRTIAVVVDDLGLSFQSTVYVRRALRKFIDEQMQPGDLVAIVRTSGGIGALQQFTSDKRQLYAAVDHIKWYASGRSGITPFAPITPPTPGAFGAEIDAKTKEMDEFREDLFSVGTLGAVSYVVKGLGDLPGRKSILLISDGFRIDEHETITGQAGLESNARNNRTLQSLHNLIDQASRASVVIYTMNASGIQNYSAFNAEDSLTDATSPTGARSPTDAAQLLSDRRTNALDQQSGLDYLAEQTGGLSIRNTNDLARGIRKILEDQRGYYLIGYRPDQSTFDPKTGRRYFHHLTLKVTRPGQFIVRMRKGFFGVPDSEAATASGTPREQILHALVSPFGASAVPIRLTSLFANDAKTGSFMRSLLHVDASALTFTDEPDGWHQAQFDVVVVTFGDNGNVVDQVARVDRLRVRGDSFQEVLKSGFVYVLTLPIKKPGAYQLRVALRDQASERLGSASQFVQVPDMKKNHLELSGILLSAGQQNSVAQPAQKSSAANQSNPNQSPPNQNEQSEAVDPAASAAVRRFRAGDALRYSFVIYNARLDKTTGQPQLQTQMRLLRNGEAVFTGKAQPFSLSHPPDLNRLGAESVIHLGSDMTPGEYVLQVIVTDLLADEKHRTATVWLDFEIVK